jgi:hypothetical protein
MPVKHMRMTWDIIFKIMEYCIKMDILSVCKTFNVKYGPIVRHMCMMKDVGYNLNLSYLMNKSYITHPDPNLYSCGRLYALFVNVQCIEHVRCIHRWYKKNYIYNEELETHSKTFPEAMYWHTSTKWPHRILSNTHEGKANSVITEYYRNITVVQNTTTPKFA